jgi:hypothetical protein
VSITCHNCSATSPDGQRYCGGCGVALDPAIIWRIFSARGLLWSLTAAIGFTLALVVVLDRFGITKYDIKTAVVLVPMLIGALLLVVLGLLSSGEISWSRQGFDFSVLGLGTVLSTLTLQFFAKTPVLPRFAAGTIGKSITTLTGDTRITMFVLLGCGVAFSVLFCLLTTAAEFHLRVRKLRNPQGKDGKGTALGSYFLGMLSLGVYALIVCGGIED